MAWQAVAAVAGIGASLWGASKASSAAKEQVKLANEAKDRQYEYDLELYKMNQDKKSLHIDENKNNNKEIINDSSLSFTIQIYASNSYKEINKYLDKLFKDVSIKKTFNKNDFYIVSFSHNLDFEYLLVYKNFLRRVDANEFCSKNINFFKKCLIVNVKNL